MEARLRRGVLGLQGAYYLVTGLWGLVHFPSFTAVVGPKPDRFQFQTTSLLITLLGGLFLAAASRARPDALPNAVAVASALALAGVEIVHMARIRKVFLLDTVTELAFAGAGMLALMTGPSGLFPVPRPARDPSTNP